MSLVSTTHARAAPGSGAVRGRIRSGGWRVAALDAHVAAGFVQLDEHLQSLQQPGAVAPDASAAAHGPPRSVVSFALAYDPCGSEPLGLLARLHQLIAVQVCSVLCSRLVRGVACCIQLCVCVVSVLRCATLVGMARFENADCFHCTVLVALHLVALFSYHATPPTRTTRVVSICSRSKSWRWTIASLRASCSATSDTVCLTKTCMLMALDSAPPA